MYQGGWQVDSALARAQGWFSANVLFMARSNFIPIFICKTKVSVHVVLSYRAAFSAEKVVKIVPCSLSGTLCNPNPNPLDTKTKQKCKNSIIHTVYDIDILSHKIGTRCVYKYTIVIFVF